MKTFSILFSLFAATAMLHASINPINPSQDKPLRLYVENYNVSISDDNEWSEYIYNYDSNGNPVDDGQEFTWYVADISNATSDFWADGAGGNGEWVWHKEINSNLGGATYDTDSVTVWPPSSYPNVLDGTVTTTGFGSDNYDTNAASPIIWEHCDIGVPLVDESDTYVESETYVGSDYLNYFQQSFFTYKDHEARNAQAVIKLQTGGKAKSQRQNLIAFNGSATQIVPVRDPFWHNPNQAVQFLNIPAQNVTINGKALGNDGNLYVVLPDGDKEVVTPTVSGVNYYTFGLAASNYTPVISANGNGNNYSDMSVTNPEFCVGQQLTFWMNWNPPNVASASYLWQLPGGFVNQASNYSSTCTTYVKNADLLTNDTTQCWYTNGQGGACSVRENLQFSNGQSVNIAATGNFTIFRPTVSAALYQNATSSFFAGLQGAVPGIQLGGDGDPRAGFHAMTYTVTYDTTSSTSGGTYTGAGGIIQLCTLDYSARPSKIFSDWRLDGNTVFYSPQANIDPFAYPVPETTVFFTDSPQNYQPFTFSTIWVIGSFQDYCMFAPEGDGSISVNLGIVTWSCDGEVRPSYIGDPGFPDALIIITNQVNGPGGPDNSDAFPLWQNTCPE